MYQQGWKAKRYFWIEIYSACFNLSCWADGLIYITSLLKCKYVLRTFSLVLSDKKKKKKKVGKVPWAQILIIIVPDPTQTRCPATVCFI